MNNSDRLCRTHREFMGSLTAWTSNDLRLREFVSPVLASNLTVSAQKCGMPVMEDHQACV